MTTGSQKERLPHAMRPTDDVNWRRPAQTCVKKKEGTDRASAAQRAVLTMSRRCHVTRQFGSCRQEAEVTCCGGGRRTTGDRVEGAMIAEKAVEAE